MTPSDAELRDRLTAWLEGVWEDDSPPLLMIRDVLTELGSVPTIAKMVRRREVLTPPFARAKRLGRPEGMEHLASLLYEVMADAVGLLRDVPDNPQGINETGDHDGHR